MSNVARPENIERNERVLALLATGKTYLEVSRETGLTKGIVSGIAERARLSPSERKRRPGCSVTINICVTLEMEKILRAEAAASKRTLSEEIRAAICAWYGIKDQ